MYEDKKRFSRDEINSHEDAGHWVAAEAMRMANRADRRMRELADRLERDAQRITEELDTGNRPFFGYASSLGQVVADISRAESELTVSLEMLAGAKAEIAAAKKAEAKKAEAK